MRAFLALFGASSAVIGLLGCLDGAPTDLHRASQPRASVTTVNGVDLVVASSRAPLRPASLGVAVIGPEGGSIEVDGASLTVPAKALSQPVVITMHGKLNDQFRFRFGPNGLRFAIPATLTISVKPRSVGVEAPRLAIAMASDDRDDWQVIGGSYDRAAGGVSVRVHHFSQYALCQN